MPSAGGDVDLGLFESGSTQIASATLAGTTLTIVFVPGVTEFEGALRVTPLADDDRDVATIAGRDLVATVFAEETASGLATDIGSATDGVNVNIDAVVDGLNLTARDGQVDEKTAGIRKLLVDLSGIELQDSDGSETIRSLELKITVATQSDGFDPSDPGQLRLAESDGTLGGFPLQINVVTTEADGGGTRVTKLNQVLTIDPVVDGGDPGETGLGFEDTAIQVAIDGNIIDNMGNSPGSPEAILDGVTISNVIPDSQGRLPTFFNGPPHAGSGGGFLNSLGIAADGTLKPTAAPASNLWLIPGTDSNEPVTFDVTTV